MSTLTVILEWLRWWWYVKLRGYTPTHSVRGVSLTHPSAIGKLQIA